MTVARSDLEREAILISQIQGLEHGAALLQKAERRLIKERELIEEQPKINCEDIKQDIKYKLGIIDALKWVIALPQEARDILTRLEGGGE